ncbi:MAG: PAS domain S-box protein [Natronomonas sp.]
MSGGVTEGDGRPVVIHLDDDDAFLGACEPFLERHGLSVRTTTSPSEALEHLDEIDCVVSDYDMPEMNGIEFLERVRERDEDIPFILFTGKGSEEIAGEAIGAGVTDYLQKGTGVEKFTVLANRIENAVERYRAEQRASEADRRIRRVYERIDDGFVALDTEWRYTYVNERATELLARDREELLGTTVWEAFPETVDSNFESALRAARERGETTSLEEFYAGGDQWLELRIFPADAGISVYFRDITERKERERRYDAIFNQTFQFTGLMEPDGTLIEANETALQFAGVDREDAIDKPLWDAYWFQLNDETRRVAYESVEQAAEGEFYRRELRIQGANRNPVIDFSVRPVTDERGEVTLLIPEGRDISELKRREDELREERAFTRSIFSALPDAFYAFDEDGQFLRWNDRFSEVTGYSDAEIEAMEPIDFIAPPDRERVTEAIADVFTDGRSFSVEARFETKGGEWLPYEFTGAQLEGDDTETLGLVGIGRDISDRRQRERRFEAVFDNTYQFTGLMEPDGTLIEANEAALEFAGVDREEVVGKPLWESFWWRDNEERIVRLKDAVERASGGEFVRYEVEIRSEEGSAIIDFSIKPVFDDDGEVSLLIPEGRDISELKQRERELERKNEQLEEFASVVSHDLKNPLAVASGNTQLARETGDLEYLDEAEAALDRMSDLVENVLSLARKGRVVDDTQSVELSDVVVDIARQAPVAVETEGFDGAVVEADRTRLAELLSNLLENAADHALGPVTVGLDDGTLYVADRGPGVPPEERATVFAPGHSSDDDGTGFGLAIVERIAEAHGWEVSVTDSEYGGARFEISGLDVQFDE